MTTLDQHLGRIYAETVVYGTDKGGKDAFSAALKVDPQLAVDAQARLAQIRELERSVGEGNLAKRDFISAQHKLFLEGALS